MTKPKAILPVAWYVDRFYRNLLLKSFSINFHEFDIRCNELLFKVYHTNTKKIVPFHTYRCRYWHISFNRIRVYTVLMLHSHPFRIPLTRTPTQRCRRRHRFHCKKWKRLKKIFMIEIRHTQWLCYIVIFAFWYDSYIYWITRINKNDNVKAGNIVQLSKCVCIYVYICVSGVVLYACNSA